MLTLLGTWHCTAVTARAQLENPDPVTYDNVRTSCRKHGVACHNPERPRDDLTLSTLEAIQAASASGPVVVSRKPEESPIYLSAAPLEAPKMPPNVPKIPQR